MKEKEIAAAKKIIGQHETEILLRDDAWGEPIIKAAVACIEIKEDFTLGVGYEDFSDLEPVIQDLLSRAAKLGVFDLAITEASTELLVYLIHWYLPPADSESEPDSEYLGEVITVEISPEIIFTDPTIVPFERNPELLDKFAKQIGCNPQKRDLLETLVDKEKKAPTMKVYLWRRQ